MLAHLYAVWVDAQNHSAVAIGTLELAQLEAAEGAIQEAPLSQLTHLLRMRIQICCCARAARGGQD